MQINKVTLNNFRNINRADIELGCGINVFYGDNGQGKTNFLESIYFASMGRSHRSSKDKELINIDQAKASARVYTQSKHHQDCISFEIEKDNKKINVNNMPIKKLGDLFGHLLCVIFSPEDLSLLKMGPQVRRRFMDMELCQLYPSYYYNLRMYYNVVRQRNNLLRSVKTNPNLTDTLDIWEGQMVTYGIPLMDARAKFTKEISAIAYKNQKEITGGKDELEMVYKNHTDESSFLDKLVKSRSIDIARGFTSVGVHKDDIEFKINGKQAKSYASQGQQRTAALSVKLAEIELIKDKLDQTPVLLLDDLLSELDASRQGFLVDKMSGLQSVITMTGAEGNFKKYVGKAGAKVFKVEGGVIS